MKKQIYYEDVEVGMELPTLVKHPTTRQLVKWASAGNDFVEIHYDKDAALAAGLPGVIVHGPLTAAFLGQLVTDWVGDGGTIKKLGCKWRGMHFPGEDLICKGRVTNKYVKDNEHYVECEIWTENPKGDKRAPGAALVVLPSRGAKK